MEHQVSNSSPIPGARPDRHGRWVLILLGSAFFLMLLDGTIVYVALPSIRQGLDFSTGGIHWVTAAYLLAFGGLLLWGGRLAERMGRRRTFVAGMGLFAAASLLCGLAWSPGTLVTGRAIQGAAAAIVAPTVLPLLAATFADDAGRAKALRVWTAIGAFAGTAGLLIGGPIVAGPGWRWIFLGSVPVGVALAAAGPFLLRNSPDRTTRHRLGSAGAVTLTAALALLAFAITGAARAGWASNRTVMLLLAAATAFAAFTLLAARATDPLLALRSIRPRLRFGGIVVLAAAGVAVDGTSLALALYLQETLGLTPTRFSLTMITMTATMIVGSFVGQAMVVRLGLRAVAIAGLTLIAAGCAILAATFGVGGVVAGLLALGPGVGAAFVAGQIAVVSAMAASYSLPASRIVDVSFSAGGVVGLAALSTMLAVRDRADQAVGQGLPTEAGFRNAFAVVLGAAVIAFAAAVPLLSRPHAGDAYAPRKRRSSSRYPPRQAVPLDRRIHQGGHTRTTNTHSSGPT